MKGRIDREKIASKTPEDIERLAAEERAALDAWPRFPTDCGVCEFIERDGPFDVYRCTHSIISGKVWRWGDGPNYTTMPEQAELLREELWPRTFTLTHIEVGSDVIIASVYEPKPIERVEINPIVYRDCENLGACDDYPNCGCGIMDADAAAEAEGK